MIDEASENVGRLAYVVDALQLARQATNERDALLRFLIEMAFQEASLLLEARGKVDG